jgi:hypothetical protein
VGKHNKREEEEERYQQPIIGIGTTLKFDNGDFDVFHISSKHELDDRGNRKVIPVVAARKHNSPGSSHVVVLTGPEIESLLN